MYTKDDETLRILYQKLSDIQEEAMRTYQEANISKTEGTKNNRFFDLHDEYKSIKCIEDDGNLSDCYSESSNIANIREDGYSSDYSDMSSIRRRSFQSSGKRFRKTRQILDSKRNSTIIDDNCTSDTDSCSLARNEQRKRRNKNYRNSKNFSDCKDKVADDPSHKRRSWTDSGVSLSLTRTDHSRCGTFENDVNSKHNSNDKDEIYQISHTVESVDNEKDNPVRRRSASCTQRLITDSKSFNRLSQLTNRSSLTNVTILTSSSMSSLSSMMSPSELEYVTDSETSDSDEDQTERETNNNLPKRKSEIEKGSQTSVTSSSTITDSTMEHKKEEFHGVKQSTQNRKGQPQHQFINPNFNLEMLISKLNSQRNIEHVEVPQKRRSILKRMKAHFRSRPSTDKNYKDVSSEFSFEKINNSKGTEHCEIVTPDVLKSLRAEESAMVNSFVDDFDYFDEDDLTDEEEEDPLERLRTPVKENKTFIGKFLKKTRSYSVSPQIEKKNKSKFNRNSIRASVRSNPEISSKSLNEQGKYTQSLEQLDAKVNRGQTDERQGRRSLTNEPYFQYDPNLLRTRNITHTTSEHCITPCRSQPCSPVKDGSPAAGVLDMTRFQSLHSVNERCDCEECMYADYLEYLEFQKFRRYYANQCHGPCCVSPHAQHAAQADIGHSRPSSMGQVPVRSPKKCDEYNENIVAPLVVTKDTEKKAKNFRTSKYESFV